MLHILLCGNGIFHHSTQHYSRPDAPEPLTPKPLPDELWQDVTIDLLGPLTGKSPLELLLKDTRKASQLAEACPLYQSKMFRHLITYVLK